tara:strand:+ start:66047 stop:68071 length:2025 start_codon:yes stop_codon:yes gene_type:complete
MKNLFKDKEIKKIVKSYKKLGVCQDLAERIYTSRLLGSNKNLVMHGGGNTSVKSETKDIDGTNHKIIYIKGSGSDLESIEHNGFPAVKINPLKKLMMKKFITDEQMVDFIKKNLINTSSPNPSVETLVHSTIEEKFVDHTHSNAILEITDQPNGLKLCKDLFGNNLLIIPYVMPGYLLAKKIHSIYRPDNNIHGLILFRHGIFTFGNTAKLSYDRMIKNVNIAESYLKKIKNKKLKKVKDKNIVKHTSEISNIIRGYLCKNQNYILTYRKNKKILSDINTHNIAKFLNKGVITPDHVIRTKPFPLVININNCNNIMDITKKIKLSIIQYKNNYIRYFKKFNISKNNYNMLDPIPQIILIQNIGMFSIGKSLKEANINADVSEMSIKTIIRIEEKSSFQSIPKKDIFDVEYWSLEQAKLNKPKKNLSGKIVLITGGAGTIGLATAAKFYEEGAEVIIIDKDKDNIEELNKKNKFQSYVCDVTNRSSVSRVLRDISLVYGGIDIVISNAGSAFQQSIAEISDKDLKKSFEINFFSHQIIASESIKIMNAQNNGGCLLFNISKQAINPGKDFGAYGSSKSALLSLCKQYALEHGKDGIRSNGVNADRIESGLLTKQMIKKRAKARGVTVENYLKGNLLHKRVFPEDVANAFYNLAIAEKTTAAVLTVDGGNIEASLR